MTKIEPQAPPGFEWVMPALAIVLVLLFAAVVVRAWWRGRRHR